jgi:hypothetical protein
MKFITNNEASININVGYESKAIGVLTAKFLVLQIDDNKLK